ncbi:unnamed protein product, partial [Symbiodinium microadriaticum]
MPDSTAMDASDRVEKGDGDFVSGTDLARAWEGVPSVRRRAAVYKLAHSAANMSYYIVHGRKCMLSGAVSSKLSKVRLPVSGMVDREAIKLNEDLLELVIQHLGTRVSVDTLDFHIQSMYGIMRMSLSGDVSSTMAWLVKRLVSAFNRISNRPHRPRCSAIRRLMKIAGIPLPEGEVVGDEGEDELIEEEEEEEELEEDPCLEENTKDVDAGAHSPTTIAPELDPKADSKPEPLIAVEPATKLRRMDLPPRFDETSTPPAPKKEQPPKAPEAPQSSEAAAPEKPSDEKGPHAGLDNVETQQWPSPDRQPEFHEMTGQVNRTLSFDGAASETSRGSGFWLLREPSPAPSPTETNPEAPPKETTPVPVPTKDPEGPRKPAASKATEKDEDDLITVSRPVRRVVRIVKRPRKQCREEKEKEHDKEEKEKEHDKEPESMKPPKAPRTALEGLPPKPSVMDKTFPSMNPQEQNGSKGTQEECGEGEAEAKQDEEQHEAEEQDEEEDGEQDDHEQDEEPEVEETEDEEDAVMKRPPAKTKTMPKQTAKAKAKSKAKAKAKVAGRPKSKVKAKAKVRAASNDDADEKAAKSRKSCAYHKARKEALDGGMSPEEAADIAREVHHAEDGGEMGLPVLLLLWTSNIDLQMQIEMLEVFSGRGAVTEVFRDAGKACVQIDKIYSDSNSMDFLSP